MPTFERPQIDTEEPVVHLYLRYSHLPVNQLSIVIGLFENLLNDLAQIYPPATESGPNFGPFSLGPTLCVESINTGASINIKVRFDRRFPTLRFIQKEQAFEIGMPNWSLLLVLVVYLLSAGMDEYKKFLEIEKLRHELREAQEPLQKIDLSKMADHSDPHVNQLNIHLNQFFLQLNQENINSATLNGVDLKGSDEKNSK